MARLLNFPAPLCTIAEQVYFAGIHSGWVTHDDASLVRHWTSEPVSSIQTALSPEEKEAKLELVVGLLVGIHLVAAAESIAFAKYVGLPLPQLYELAVEAAGGSTMFKEFGTKMISVLEGKSGEEADANLIGDRLAKLRRAVEEAQTLKIPLYLGSSALTLLLQTEKDLGLASLLKLYT